MENALASPYTAHKWALETLVGELLTCDQDTDRLGWHHVTDCTAFATIAKCCNLLRTIEENEAAIYLPRFHGLLELHRIGHRQFQWQRGFFNKPQFYRYAYIYGQGKVGEYFEHKFGLSVNEFSLLGFSLYATFQNYSGVTSEYSFQQIGLTEEKRVAGLALLSISVADALARNHRMRSGAPLPTAYKSSVIRQFPIIAFDNQALLICPLPELIVQRVTAGVYYDIVGGPGHLRNEAAARFEEYCSKLFGVFLPDLSSIPKHSYRYAKNIIETPDLLFVESDEILLAAECKATKLSFGAQFSEAPLEEAKRHYGEISKAVFQLWKYFAHVRAGIAPGLLSAKLNGVVLTLDPWLVASAELIQSVISEAQKLADNEGVSPQDRRPVTFCPANELEYLLSISTRDQFLSTLTAAAQSQYCGWPLPSVWRELHGAPGTQKDFTLDLGDVLPWWRMLDELRAPSNRTA